MFLLLFLGTFANSLHWQAHLAYSTYVSTLQGNQKTLLDKVKDLLTSVRTKQSDITKESDATVRIAKL